MKFLAIVETWNRPLSIALSAALVLAIGALTFLAGPGLILSPLYLLPLALLAWKGGRWVGLGGALLATVVWALADWGTGRSYTPPFLLYVNGAARLVAYAVLALLVSSARALVGRLEAMSLTDHLTGAANGRMFQDMLKCEIARASRYRKPFTLSYLDLDNFKKINDSLGHATGDSLLRVTVSTIRRSLRASDVVARLGGDEFALLLPESDLSGARIVIGKVRSAFLREMEARGWPVTVSAGSVTCVAASHDDTVADELMKTADALLYEAKDAGKDTASFSTVPNGKRRTFGPPGR
jgi:diguanylate cyclase (GGDEF)-like protein